MFLKYFLRLTLLLLLSALTLSSAADDGTWTYTLSGDEATITGCVATCPAELVIPSEVDGYKVTGIGITAFSGKGLTSVVIPSSVEDIKVGAFSSNGITELEIPGNVTDIGTGAFRDNPIASLTISDGVTNIGNSAFYNCDLTSLVIPDSVRVIDFYAFSMNQLNTLNIAEGVTDIMPGAFRNNELISVVIPNSVKNLGFGAFGNNKLTRVVLSAMVANIEDYTFIANQLEQVLIPQGVESIGEEAFYLNPITKVLFLGNRPNFPSGTASFDVNYLELVAYCEGKSGWPGADVDSVTPIADCDLDGVIDAQDAFPSDSTESLDTDNDGTGNNADTDDDDDGVADSDDAFPLDLNESSDTDGDGIGNNADSDDDNDGVLDTADAFPLDATETLDTDSDGTGNNADDDDDGDGVPDTADGYALISLGVLLDTDSDGFPNECDEDCLATGMTADSDDDNDGVEDTSDAFPLDSSLWSLKVEDVLAEISDKNLRGCVEKAVIGLIQVADLTVLDCSERDIVNLTGLQKFIWLTKLELRFNQIADLSSLLNQSNLLELGLQGNPIDWLTFPEGLTGIQILRGNGTKLDSTFRIPSYLALTLKDLDISYQNTDLMDLAGLSLFSKLERLNFSGNPSIDWSSLPALANVTFLGAHGTGLERLSQLLPSAGNLETADLSNNKIIDLALIDQLVELKHLNVAYNEINDISQLENPLITLNLGGNLLADIAPLKIYREASQGELWLWDNPIRRIGDLFIHWKNLRVNFESNVNQTSMELSCQEIEYVNGYIDSTLVITWPSFSPCRNDPDRDYFYGDEDAFPNDPAASVDTDEDGKPDDWHEGRSESDSTSDPALVLDDDDDNDGIDDEIEQANGTNPRNADSDGDALDDNLDNCPSLTNSDQLNTDGDTEGDACDSDDDNDGFSDDQEELDGTNPKSRFSCKSGCFSFDVDENLEAQPLTDGLLVIRHLFGFSGDSLTSGAVAGEANRDSSEAITGYLIDAVSELDIDGDGESKPLTDGLLLIRYLFGFSGDSLISGAIGSGAERDTAEEVEAYIRERVPVQ